MIRAPGHTKYLLAAVALMSGCTDEAVEEATIEDLTPADAGGLTQIESTALTRVDLQQITSVSYSTYLGFSGLEYGNAIAIDGAGNAYITGTTTSFVGTKIYVAKMSPSGTNVYYTYFPGTASRSIAVDSAGNAYVVGTISNKQTLVKLDATGAAIVYSAIIGWPQIWAVKVDTAGNAYLTGSALTGANDRDVAVGKVNAAGTAFLYNVSFGGNGLEEGRSIAIDAAGNAYVTGVTASTNFPVASAFQSVRRGIEDAFVTKVNAAGTGILFSTYLGGNAQDAGNGIALDGNNNVYVAGSTSSLNGVQSFPVTAGSAQSFQGGGGDAFVTKFSSSGARIYSTYVGGSGGDSAEAIAVTPAGAAYITGATTSSNFPTTALGALPFPLGGTDAFVVQLNTTGSAFTYSTYWGGNDTDVGNSITVNSAGTVYTSGYTFSTNFPTNVYTSGGGADAYVTKFNGP